MKLFGKENHFYHASIRRYVALFGSLFSDMYIKRVADGGVENYVSIPIRYASGNMYMKVAQDETREIQKVARILPAMAFKLNSIYKDKERNTNPLNRITQSNSVNDRKNFQQNRIPYNFLFDLIIKTKNTDDMMQIVEQIVPEFNGNLSITIEDTTGISVEQDITIILNEIAMEDNYDDDVQNRLIEWTITFELKGFLYRKTQSAFVIREVDLIDITYDMNELIEVITDQYPIQDTQINLSNMDQQIDNISSTEVKVKRKKRTTKA